MLIPHHTIKTFTSSLCLSATIVLVAFAVVIAVPEAIADSQQFDLGPDINPNLSAGQGYIPTAGQGARTNVSFSDFGYYTPNPNPQAGSNPADLLPINQQNSTTTGMEIYSRNGQENYKLDGSQPTQMYSQAPKLQPGQMNPYMAGQPNPSNTSLAPTTMGLQSTYSYWGTGSLPTGAHHFRHLDYGFEKRPMPAIYQGAYNNFIAPNVRNLVPNTVNSTPFGILPASPLPPVSLGSVDINVAAGQPR